MDILKNGNNICPSNRRGKRNFSKLERQEFAKILAMNGYNYSKTQKQLKNQDINISISTLKNYNRLYGDDFKQNHSEKFIKDFETKIADREQNFLDDVFTVCELALERMKDLVPQERNLKVVCEIANVLNKIIQDRMSNRHDHIGNLTLIDQINQHLTVNAEKMNSDSKT